MFVLDPEFLVVGEFLVVVDHVLLSVVPLVFVDGDCFFID
jgi:hypothetical protein